MSFTLSVLVVVLLLFLFCLTESKGQNTVHARKSNYRRVSDNTENEADDTVNKVSRAP